jgi:hypothetical protein
MINVPQTATITMPEFRRQCLMKILTDYVVTDNMDAGEMQEYANILRDVGIACAPAPLGADENIGSCEPGPLIRWDKTQSTWHTDIENVGRYSVRRAVARGPWAAYLNGERVAGVPAAAKVDAVKRDVENRIRNAMQIAKLGHMITSK